MAEQQQAVTPARVPPSNLRAEESVLGAMLLSREAIAEVVENLDPDHFYKPAHGHLYDAIMGLYGAGQPVDAVTVAEELQRAGLLEDLGGPSLLLELQQATPAISNAGHYAKIVEEHALLRRLISVSNEIAEMAYGVPDDVIKAIDDAEARMFEVAQRRVTNTTAQIKDLLSANLDRLETLYERGEAITGTRTGYADLDELLSGLQPEALYVVGARPAMGKALALDTPLPTPSGWLTMGEVEVGDKVFDETGNPTTVTYKSPVFVGHHCFEVIFDDGSTIVADADHQWQTWNFTGGSRVLTTQQMVDEFGTADAPRQPIHRVPVTQPLECREVNLDVDPYQYGCRLGVGLADDIPASYRRAAFKQRLALVQGLMDTAGELVDGSARCRPANSSTKCRLVLTGDDLLAQSRELITSLGYKITGQQIAGGSWSVDFFALDPVFRRASMAERQSIDERPDSDHRWRTIVDIKPVSTRPTQCITVDSPNHLYLAGLDMVPTHNTAFGLGMIAAAAMQQSKPTLFFSLEMGQLELSQRILCSEALVDSSRVRSGRIEDAEWNRISHAVGRLAEAPIYIDDNPQTSVMEIRAKARRLKSRVGDLGMVVVDYIQLMTGRAGAESRQVEVSEISRGLKILARELQAPVVALAQLNRALEQRVDKRPMLSDLRESGCMPASTRITLADGTEMTMGDLLATRQTPMVRAIDDQGRIVARQLVKTFESGIKPVFKLRLASGRQVEATACHKFMTAEGWRPLGKISPGQFVATPRRLPEPAFADEWPEAEVVLLAHLLGDGSLDEAVTYTSADPANVEAVRQAVRHFDSEAVDEGDGSPKQAGATLLRVPAPQRRHLTHGAHHPIRDWLEPLGLWGKRSHEKTIPEPVHRLSDKQVSHFLHHLWSTDGSIAITPDGRDPLVRCHYATTSHQLALGVQRLLQRFEIQTTVSATSQPNPGAGYQVRVEGRPDLLRFLKLIGCHGAKGECVPQAIAILEQTQPNQKVDVATSDIYWDEVVAIEPLGEQPVFDCTVETDHNFIANGIVAHNSLEQDADVVMFLYRDEVYDDQSPDKGLAEVIVAKHRNGPTGKVKLAFRGQYTRFDNMARSAPGGGPPPSADEPPPPDF